MSLNTVYGDLLESLEPTDIARNSHSTVRRYDNQITIDFITTTVDFQLYRTGLLQLAVRSAYIKPRTKRFPDNGLFVAMENLDELNDLYPIPVDGMSFVFISTHNYIKNGKIYRLPQPNKQDKLVVYDTNHKLVMVLDVPAGLHAASIAEYVYTGQGYNSKLCRNIINAIETERKNQLFRKIVIGLLPETWLRYMDKYVVHEMVKYLTA